MLLFLSLKPLIGPLKKNSEQFFLLRAGVKEQQPNLRDIGHIIFTVWSVLYFTLVTKRLATAAIMANK